MQRLTLQTGPDHAVIHRVAPPLPPGREFASGKGWTLVEPLGNGTSSHVWRATDAAGREVALKISHGPLARNDASVALLAREHSLLAELAHPNIVATFGLVPHGATTALALECLTGGDLVALTGAHPRHWIRAVLDVRAALAHLHARGFVHRDVKARNVLFGADGRARLIDFSSVLPRGARQRPGGTTAAHRVPGVPRASVEAHEDAHAFGVLLYELLAGRLPWGAGGPAEAEGAPDVPWPLEAGADLAATALAARVLEVLAAHDAGLSAYADVLESSAAAYR